MKRKGTLLLLGLTCLFAAFCGGFFLGRNLASSPVQITQVQSMPHEKATEPLQNEEDAPLNINTASKAALMTLPGIGEVLAQRILDYRKTNGSFQSPAELMYVEGIGEQRLEELLPYITTGG